MNGFKKCGFRPFRPEACYDKILGAKERRAKKGCGKKGCTAEQDKPPAPPLSKTDEQHKKELIAAIKVWVDAQLPKEQPKKAPRYKVQHECGEILTCPESIERLKVQHLNRGKKRCRCRCSSSIRYNSRAYGQACPMEVKIFC